MEDLQVMIEQQAGAVSFNFNEMKEYLNNRLEEYRGAVFTDDSIKTAKACTAQLRKEQAAFKSRVSEVRKEYMKPFDEFKSKADELILLYDEPINFINGQVSDFEERRKEEKKKVILRIYGEVAADVKEYIPLDKIYNPKWENATYKEKDIVKDISEAAEGTRQAIATIEKMNSEAVPKALELYKRSLSLTDAITYINNYERQKAEILAREQEKQKQAEIEKIREEERKKVLAEQEQERKLQEAVSEAKEEGKQEAIEILTPEAEEKTQEYMYKFTLGEKAKETLEMYLDSVGITYKLIF